MNMPKIDIVKVVSIAGTVLGLVGTVATAWASDKKLDTKVAEAVAKASQHK